MILTLIALAVLFVRFYIFYILARVENKAHEKSYYLNNKAKLVLSFINGFTLMFVTLLILLNPDSWKILLFAQIGLTGLLGHFRYKNGEYRVTKIMDTLTDNITEDRIFIFGAKTLSIFSTFIAYLIIRHIAGEHSVVVVGASLFLGTVAMEKLHWLSEFVRLSKVGAFDKIK